MKDREIDSFIENPLQPKSLITDCTNAYLILNIKKDEKLNREKEKYYIHLRFMNERTKILFIDILFYMSYMMKEIAASYMIKPLGNSVVHNKTIL